MLNDPCSNAILSNTTTPTTQQITGLLGYSDEDIKLVLDDQSSVRPFPVSLVVIARHITEVRVQAASKAATSSALQYRMQQLFREIDNFDPNAWAENVDFYQGDVTPAIGQIFQIATRLHSIVALPASIIAPALVIVYPGLAGSGTLRSVCDSVRISQRAKLLARLRDTWPSLGDTENMDWPLLVAGVALADGPAEDKEYVARLLDGLWQGPLDDVTSLLAREKLRRFWRSGLSGWEDCFDEPFPS